MEDFEMAEEKRVNLKAAKFQKYLDDNKLTFFRRDASNLSLIHI